MIDKNKIAKELFDIAKLVAKKEVPQAFKDEWKNEDKDGDGKKNEPKPEFLKKASESRVDTFKRIVKDHQNEEIDGVIVDVQTASLLVQIFDALKKPALKKKFEKMPIKQLAGFAWKMVK